MNSATTQNTLPPDAPSGRQHGDQTQAEAHAAPSLGISTLICTRNRPGSIAAAVESVLANIGEQAELIVVDQSTNGETAAALAPFLSDPRLRYLPTGTTGKSTAVNIGIEAAQNEVLVMTDDDCEATPGWDTAFARIFRDNPNAAVAYGSVTAPEFDTTKGFTPVYTVEEDFICKSIRDKLRARGIGANMAVRREMALKIGGFDTELGPGGRFRACEDGDFAVRCLLAGYFIYETKNSTIIHYGFRTWAEGRQLTRDAFLGIGAAYIKPLKCGHFSVLSLLLYEFWACALLPSIKATLTLKKPLNWQRVAFFFRGVCRGLFTSVDREKITYLPKKSAEK